MIAYQYHADGSYAGEIEDFGLLPSNSTYAKPPQADGFFPVWNGEIWTLVEDHRGEQGFLNGQSHEIKELGPYPEGWSLEAPEPDLESEISQIKGRLAELDAASIRPLRAIAENKATTEDTEKLKTLDAEAEALRTRLRELGVDEVE